MGNMNFFNYNIPKIIYCYFSRLNPYLFVVKCNLFFFCLENYNYMICFESWLFHTHMFYWRIEHYWLPLNKYLIKKCCNLLFLLKLDLIQRITHKLVLKFLMAVVSPWVIKNSCMGWGSRKWHHQLRDYNRRTKARCRTVPNPRCMTGAQMLFTKICKCFLTRPKEASVGHIPWNATNFLVCATAWCFL